jgi:uncharacterized membrane protein HdeD (DUF308 family)
MTNLGETHSENQGGWTSPRLLRARGVAVVGMGCLAVLSPFLAGTLALLRVGLLLIACGVLEMLETFQTDRESERRSAYLSGALSVLAGILLLAQPQLVMRGLALFVAGSFLVDAIGKTVAAVRARASGAAGKWLLAGGLINAVLALVLVARWPVSGNIEAKIQEAARLRREFGVSTGWQRGPFFEVQTGRFALIAVDTGVLRRVDTDQWTWLKAALERSRGKFIIVILGHPLYAGGRYQGGTDEPIAGEWVAQNDSAEVAGHRLGAETAPFAAICRPDVRPEPLNVSALIHALGDAVRSGFA